MSIQSLRCLLVAVVLQIASCCYCAAQREVPELKWNGNLVQVPSCRCRDSCVKVKVRSVKLAVRGCERSKFDEPHQAETAIDHLSLILLIAFNMFIDTVIDVMRCTTERDRVERDERDNADRSG